MNLRIYPFVYNVIYKYIMPGVLINVIVYELALRFGTPIDARQKLDELFAKLEAIENDASSSASETKPLLT